jgi:TolB-like protein/DNA-binding SARP family transcriptional activator
MLGGFELTGADGGCLMLPRKKLRALVALMALAPPAGWPREQLMALLWGGRDEEQARGSLRQGLAELRRILGDAAVLTDRETATFDPAAVTADAVEFARLAAAECWEQAAALYHGDLLDSVSLPDAEFADWLLVERTRLRDLAVRVLARLLEGQSGPDAIGTAQRLLQLDPTREETHRMLMRIYAAQGDRARALRQYQLCRDSLRRDLDVRPEPETERLCKEIQVSAIRSAPLLPPQNGQTGDGSDVSAPGVMRPAAEVALPRGVPHDPLTSTLIAGGGRARFARRSLAAAVACVSLLLVAALVSWHAWVPTIEPAVVERMALPLPDKPSIAVLPFGNMSDDPKQAYLADGVADGLIMQLSQVSGLVVISANSTFVYNASTTQPRQVAEELGVRYVLEGGSRRTDDHLQITAQLIDVVAARYIWADRVDGSATDVFTLQERLARSIAGILAVRLTDAEDRALAQPETSVPAAYESFLRGWAHYRRARRQDFAQAIPYFEDAVRLDPDYGRAHAALAMIYFLAYDEGWPGTLGLTENDAFWKSSDHLQLAGPYPTSISHQVAGNVSRSRDWDDDAVKEFHAALALDPNDASAYAYLSLALIYANRPAEAATQIDIAMRLDPHYPPAFLFYRGLADFEQNRMAPAAVTLEKAARLNLDDPRPLLYLAAAYGHLGRDKEAAAIITAYSSARVSQGGLPFVMAELGKDCWHFRPPAESLLVRGLRRAGVPDNFDSALPAPQALSANEVETLFFGHSLHGRTVTSGSEHGVSVSTDGTALTFGDWGRGSGTAQMVGNRICLFSATTAKCGTILRNPGGSKAQQNEYIWFAHEFSRPFSQIE